MSFVEFEVKIGLFVFIAIILLTIITFSIGDFLFKSGYNIDVIFSFANGVQNSAPVRLAGIEVGEVKEAAVFKDQEGKTKVRLKLWLTSDANIENDSKVCINTLGLIGEKYVEIIPGTPGRDFLKEGDSLVGVDSVSMEAMTKRAYDIGDKLNQVADSLNSILTQIQSGQGTLGKLVYDEALYDNIENMVSDIKDNPWKLLQRPRVTKDVVPDKAVKGNRGIF